MNIFKNILVAGITGVITLLSGVCVGLPSCYLFTNPTQIKIKDMKANTEEVWKDIKGYEGLYQVSNRGRVKSLERRVVGKNGNMYYYHEKIKKACLMNHGYMVVDLHKNGKNKHAYIHRLIAEYFIPNPENKPQINHKNGIRHDNRIENLEWVTCYENNKHMKEVLKTAYILPPKYGKDNPKSRRILQFTKEGKFIKSYETLTEAERCTGAHHSNISKVALGKRNFAGGFVWKYADDVNDKNIKYAT